jgi:hypothetical protein
MAVLSGNRIAWTYTSDNGQDYRVAAQKALTDQNKLGGTAAASTLKAKPGSMKMRRITVSDDSGRSRVVPVYSLDAAILVAGAEINVNYLGDSHTLSSSGNPIPESHTRQNVTKESA